MQSRRRDHFEEKPQASNRTTTHRQLEMSPQAMVRLQKLKDRSEAVSHAQVIGNALRLYEALVEEYKESSEYVPKRLDGETVKFKIFV